MSRSYPHWALALLALSLAACGVAPAGESAPPMLMRLGMAEGSAPFVQLADGADSTLIEGAQGGFHVWMKFRIDNTAPMQALVVRSATRVSDDAVVLRSQPLALSVGAPGDDGEWELPMALPMFMCPTPIGIRVADEPIRYRIALTTPEGVELSAASVVLVPRCPGDPGTSHDFCQKICLG